METRKSDIIFTDMIIPLKEHSSSTNQVEFLKRWIKKIHLVNKVNTNLIITVHFKVRTVLQLKIDGQTSKKQRIKKGDRNNKPPPQR